MSDINRFIATGRLTADAVTRTIANGKTVMSMNAAINTGYGDYKKTLFVKVQQWGDSALNVVQYLKKGTLIGIDGALSTNSWKTKEGENRTDVVVDVRAVQILSSKKEDASSTSETPVDDGSGNAVF